MSFTISSSNSSIIIPIKTTVQRDAISASSGMIVYNSDLDCLNYYDNSVWNYISPRSFTVPWTAFQYFVFVLDVVPLWTPTSAQNGSGYGAGGTNLYSYGSCTVNVPITGTWRITVSYAIQSNHGITRFAIDGTNTDRDGYSASRNYASYSWTQSISAKSITIAISNNGKNASASSYWLANLGDGITFQLE